MNTAPTLRRCPQCWGIKPTEAFLKRDGTPGRQCIECRGRYGNWAGKTLAEKLDGRERIDPVPRGRVMWVACSQNRKLGPIPTTMSERGTCPPSCGLYLAGCYAGYGKLGGHWKRVGAVGLTWKAFLAKVRALPEGQLWRHNEAGDLAGAGHLLDYRKLSELTDANRGRRGFTYSHKHATGIDRRAIYLANNWGFTVNISADTLEQADELARYGVGPVTVILPEDAPDRGMMTPEGRRVVVCPAQTSAMTCVECRLCAHPTRQSVIGFRAHGQFSKHVPELVQIRRNASS
jgi:hypothetical protein